jgi:hypothetical protein
MAVDDFRQLTGLDQATSDDTITLARTAAGAIRGLNWLTGREAGLRQPSAAYDVIGALALAAGRLGHDLGEAIDATGIFPGDASMSAAALAQHLNQAWQQLALINGHPRNHNNKEQS